MDWITGMQRAIDYIEANMTEKLDYREIARQAYSSEFHFQRVFSIMCGYTIGEYIRNRRLTLAGRELADTNAKVIDAAIKYGYETAESFTRAFTRFHGVNPSCAREKEANLKSFSRLSIKISLKGGSFMDYRIEKKQAFKIIAKTKYFSTKDEANMTDIPKFWEECHRDGTIDELCRFVNDNGVLSPAILGVCEEDTDERAGEFPYSIASEYTGGAVPHGFEIKEVPEYTWVIFKCKGAMPDAIQDGWHKIYTEFFPGSEYDPIQTIDLEVYPDGDMDSKDYISEIWIPVEKKN